MTDDRIILAYHGNQDMDSAMRALTKPGPRAAVMAIGRSNGGNARKISAILIKKTSIFPP